MFENIFVRILLHEYQLRDNHQNPLKVHNYYAWPMHGSLDKVQKSSIMN
jgi:hypothetical protein